MTTRRTSPRAARGCPTSSRRDATSASTSSGATSTATRPRSSSCGAFARLTSREHARSVAYGVERTGRIITAAALIMVAAFSGFVAGRVAGLQEFGVGLALAVFIDVTLVRIILVPSLMAIFGRWNWWLPRGGGP